MTCPECRELQTHEFRSQADLLHAIQVAAAEVDRGALGRVGDEDRTASEQEAMDSVFASEALPEMVRYRFKCTVCADLFELWADTCHGKGGWTRQEK